MFPTRWFCDRWFAPRWFPKVGATQIVNPRLVSVTTWSVADTVLTYVADATVTTWSVPDTLITWESQS